MTTSEDCIKALDEAITIAGGLGALARRIGVAPSAPSMWKKRQSIPAEYCPAIERETGVVCERLRPGVPWDVLRLQAAAEPEPRAA
jgi:DNA-binding transcriptional regulator YdaS (Cro superfamily)